MPGCGRRARSRERPHPVEMAGSLSPASHDTYQTVTELPDIVQRPEPLQLPLNLNVNHTTIMRIVAGVERAGYRGA
jgi:hypothetical protein